jgi:hypothetical protein
LPPSHQRQVRKPDSPDDLNISNEQIIRASQPQGSRRQTARQSALRPSRVSEELGTTPTKKSPAVNVHSELESEADDDDFQVDARVPSSSKRKQRAPSAVTTPTKRLRVDAEAELPPTPSIRPELPPDEADLAAVTERARAMTVMSRRPAVPQTRRPWSSADQMLLIKAVDSYDAKWADMADDAVEKGVLEFEKLRDQPALRDKGKFQQALRDKARLLKMEFLK